MPGDHAVIPRWNGGARPNMAARGILTSVIKRFFARLAAASILTTSLSVPGFAQDSQTFIDTVGHPHESEILFLSERAIVEGYGYGIFRPDAPINRAEFLKILMTAAYGKEEVVGDQSSCFRDFVGTQQWYWIHACLAKQRRIIEGYPDGTFRGDKTVNLAEALKIAIHAWSVPVPQIDVSPDLWYLPYFAVASQRGLFEYFPKNAGHLMTRSEMAYLIVALRETIQDARTVRSVVVLDQSSVPTGPVNNPAVCGNAKEEPGEQCDDGNTVDGDGCSSICVAVAEPVHHGVLRLEERSIPLPRVSAGTENASLFGFELLAARQDVNVTQIRFAVTSGDPKTASSYSLWIDTDADESVDTLLKSATVEGNTVVFSGFEISLKDGVPVRAELKADIAQNAAQPFTIGFATDDPAFVAAVDRSDGRELSGIELNGAECTLESICWISVLTDGPQTVSILGRGNLFITASERPVPAKQLILGSTTDDLLRLSIRAEAEPIEITDIRFTGVPANIANLYLFRGDESNPVSAASTTGCRIPVQGNFCMTTSFVVGADEEIEIGIRATLKARTQGGKSGQGGAIRLDASAPDTVLATGAESKQALSMSDGDNIGNGEIFIGTAVPGPGSPISSAVHVPYSNRIVAIRNASSDADGSAVTAGTRSIGAFAFTAGDSIPGNEGYDDVMLKNLVFDVTATNVQFLAGTFKIFNADEPGKAAACTESAITGLITVTCSNIDQLISTVARAGEELTLDLQALILESGKAGSQSILQTSLSRLSDPLQTGTILWSDDQNTVDWVDIGTTSVRSTQYKQ